MEIRDYSRYRDIVQWELETLAKVPFIKIVKNEPVLTVGYDVWLSLEHIEKTANSMHSEFKNLWKWVKNVSPHLTEFKTAYHTLVNLLFLLKYDIQEELNRWKTELKNNNQTYFYNLPKVSANWYSTNN